MSTKQIARALALSPSTIDNHLQAATARYDIKSRFEAARLYKIEQTASSKDAISPADAVVSDDNENDQSVNIEMLHDRENFEIPIATRLLRLPPLGGRFVTESHTGRLYRIVQIALLSLLIVSSIILSIMGAVLLLEPVFR